ncbi:MAG: class I SAM-dependent methyltransferase [Candidatus Dormibacteraeota bacterium]|nr:class I SAM-dependent methyltransferase [Candidatus Dormibacteraeota bacterium]
MSTEPSDHAPRNRASWDGRAAKYVEPGRRAWADNIVSWGIWHIPETEVGALPEVDGRDVVELGCGTAYISSWLARRGARPVGVDNSPAQLETARRLQAEFDIEFPLLLADAEQVPLPDASFDLAVSEYGASIWCDPFVWIPEAARLLRPGGHLVFLGNAALLMLCVNDDENVPASATLRRDYFGMHRFEWPDDPAVEFHLPHGEMLRLLRDTGFEVLDLIELQAPVGATTRYAFVDEEWARRWPSEEIWVARKRSS